VTRTAGLVLAAGEGRRFGGPVTLNGPVGEVNRLVLHGRGVFACISPWNFPLAIFIGPVAAALAAGNSAIAKPAEQTPLIGARAIELMHQAGIPADVVQIVPGDGKAGAALTAHPLIAGVAFTGPTDTPRAPHPHPPKRQDGPLLPPRVRFFELEWWALVSEERKRFFCGGLKERNL